MRESVVLLKNDSTDGDADKKILPINTVYSIKVAFIGPYIEGQDMRSSWSVSGDEKDNVTLKTAAQEAFGGAALAEGSEEKQPGVQLRFAEGCTLLDNHTIINLGQYDEDNW